MHFGLPVYAVRIVVYGRYDKTAAVNCFSEKRRFCEVIFSGREKEYFGCWSCIIFILWGNCDNGVILNHWVNNDGRQVLYDDQEGGDF